MFLPRLLLDLFSRESRGGVTAKLHLAYDRAHFIGQIYDAARGKRRERIRLILQRNPPS